jgi:hypothetical protein
MREVLATGKMMLTRWTVNMNRKEESAGMVT